ncbi:MAG: c-type cytochrome [Verrucomicrobiota bacterium]
MSLPTAFPFRLAAASCVLVIFGVSGCGEAEPPPPLTISTWVPEDPILVSGMAVYDKTCSLCHHEGEEGAPRLSHDAQWEVRREKGIDTLIKHAIEGFHGDDGDMPAKGGRKSYTDEEVEAAVRYMFEASKL